MTEHNKYLERCQQLAEIAAAAGESAVGSVVVLDGKIIGEGSEKSRQMKDVTRHAEVVAILDAVEKYGHCRGSILYSNVEPCILCSYVVRHHQISKVVFSKLCGELGGTTPAFNILTTDQISVWTKAPLIEIIK